MKRIFPFFLAVLLLFSAGCASETENSMTSALSDAVIESQTVVPTTEPTPEPYRFTFDRYLLPVAYENYLKENEPCAELWPQLVDAVHQKDTSFYIYLYIH